MKCGVFLIVYQVVNVIINITRQLSIPDQVRFNLSYIKNSLGSFENYYSIIKLFVISLLVALIAIFIVLPRFNVEDYINRIQIKTRLIWINILFILFALNPYFLTYLNSHTGTLYLLDGKNVRYLWQVLLVLIVIYILSWIFYNGLHDLTSNHVSFYLAFTVSAFLALIFEMTLQYTVGTDDRWILTNGGQYLGWLVLFLTFFLVFALINRFVIATAVIITSFSALTVGSYLKYKYRSEPVFLTDLVWLKNIKELAGFVNSKLLVVSSVLLVLIISVTIILAKKVYRYAIFKKHLTRLISVALSLALLFVINYNVNQIDISKRIPLPVIQPNDTDPNLFIGNKRTAIRFSLPYIWLRETDSRLILKPEGYTETRMREIKERYTKLAKEINQTRGEEISDSTVIYVLSESFSDPTRITDSSFSVEPIPNIRSLVDSGGGYMFSSGLGGGTANMEFETLTSFSLNNFTSAGKYPYVSAVPRMTYVPAISNLFKDKIAIHPFDASGYNRENVFNKMGMRFIADGGDEEIPGEYRKIAGRQLYMSDEGVYDAALRELKNGNQFFHLITMQNHQPYEEGNYESPEISVENPTLSDETLEQLHTYAQGVMITDTATQNFLNQLGQIDQKITVVFWGDHLPGIYQGDKKFVKNFTADKSQLTDYFIWSNYQDETIKKAVIAPYNFTPLMLEKTNAYVTPYYAFETEILNKLPAIEMSEVIDENQKVTPESKYHFSKEQHQLLQDYKLIQYDLINGEEYLTKDIDFFEKIVK